MASPISGATESTRILRAPRTGSVGWIESVITNSLSFDPVMRPTALVMNIGVGAIGTTRFVRARAVPWRLLVPLCVGEGAAREIAATGSSLAVLAAAGLHMAAMLVASCGTLHACRFLDDMSFRWRRSWPHRHCPPGS